MKTIEAITSNKVFSFLVIAIMLQIIGGTIGWATQSGVDNWYDTLNRSPFTPPNATFGIVWSLLYLMLAYVFWTIWHSRPKDRMRNIIIDLFIVHMVVNWSWSIVFFQFHYVALALYIILVMILTAAMLAWLVWKMDPKASIVFVPYIAWLIFAGHLTHFIMQNN